MAGEVVKGGRQAGTMKMRQAGYTYPGWMKEGELKGSTRDELVLVSLYESPQPPAGGTVSNG